MSPELRAHLDNIMDCMTGTDGGIAFVKLKTVLEDIDQQAQGGNDNSHKILECVVRFSKLITLAKGI